MGRCGSVTGSASNSMGRETPICQCWRPSHGSVGGPRASTSCALLDQYAPSWLVQMPTLLSAAELEALQRRGRGATQARMLRELAEAMEALTAERPLLLVLEDLHWSDYATLEWLAFVARRRERAQLLVIGTYRPMDVLVRAHPVRTVMQELQRHGQCAELPLAYLTEAGVAAYLAARYAGRSLPEGLARLIQRRTGGNPLFLVSVVDAMVRQGVLQEDAAGWAVPEGLEAVAVELPESLRHLIEQQLGQVSPEDRRVLEAASVAGVEFSAAAVAAGVNMEASDVEERCAELARRQQFLQARGTVEWPDGTVAARYGFIHAVYQEGVYERVPAGRRVWLHQRIGARQEAGYSAQAQEIAAALAVHFECGRDIRRADTVSVAGREKCAAAQCPSGGNRPLDQGIGTPQDAARHPGASPARTRVASVPRDAAHCHQGLGGPGSGHRLPASAGAVGAGGRDAAVLLGAVWPVCVACHARGVADRAGADGAVARTGPARPPPDPAHACPPGAGGDLVLPGSIYCCPRAHRTGAGALRSTDAQSLCL